MARTKLAAPTMPEIHRGTAMALLSGTLQPDEGDIGERKANRIAKCRGSANPEGNVRDVSRPSLQRAPQQGVEPGERALPGCLWVVAYLVAGRVLAQLEPGAAAGLVEEFQPQPDPGRPPGAGYRADIGVRHQQLVLDDLVQCHIDRSAASRVRVAHQHKTLETAGPGFTLHRLARHGEARRPEPLAQLVGVDEGPVDQFARRVEDARDGDFPPWLTADRLAVRLRVAVGVQVSGLDMAERTGLRATMPGSRYVRDASPAPWVCQSPGRHAWLASLTSHSPTMADMKTGW